MYKAVFFAVLPFAIAAQAQVPLPPPPAPFLLSNLSPHATQKVIAKANLTIYPTCSACGTPSDPNFLQLLLLAESTGGNQYDAKGNYYFARLHLGATLNGFWVPASWDSLWMRTPGGNFSKFADLTTAASCSGGGTTFTTTFGTANLGYQAGIDWGGWFPALALSTLTASGYPVSGPAGNVLPDVQFSVNPAANVLEIVTISFSVVYVLRPGGTGACQQQQLGASYSGGEFVGNNYDAYGTFTISLVQVSLD
jgi:hypothetical protein